MDEITQADIDEGRRKAEKKYESFTADEIALLRRKCKTNLFFLAKGILCYNLLAEGERNPDGSYKRKGLHLELCEWIKATNNAQFREVLLPRSHFKSTVFTISDTVQIILPDDLGDQPYPRNLGTNCRVLIAHEVAEEASKFLGSITSHFTVNPLLMGLFPECIPNARTQKLNKLELELPRTSIWNEPTVNAMGVGTKSQGRHFNQIKCDDIYGTAARDSKAERDSTISWTNNLQAFLITPKTDHIDWVGTRYAHDDVYAHLHKVYGSKLKKYIRSVEEYRIGEDGRKVKDVIFPENFDKESLDILRQDSKVWNSQYVNNPFEGGSNFQPEWLRYYHWKINNGRTRKLIKFNGSESSETTEIDVEDLDKVILIDPAMNGLAGFIVTGTDRNMDIFVLEAMKKEWKPPELVELIFQQVLKWRPRVVAIEEVLFSGLFQHWLAREMMIRGIKFRIIPVKTRQKAKDARVLGLSNYFSAGQIYFQQGMKDLINEFLEFGATDDYHMLDALAYGPELWKAGINVRRQDFYNSVENKLLADRDGNTGYGRIEYA
jgi:predicted phage terminase large subunit-like protein